MTASGAQSKRVSAAFSMLGTSGGINADGGYIEIQVP